MLKPSSTSLASHGIVAVIIIGVEAPAAAGIGRDEVRPAAALSQRGGASK